MNGLLPRVFQIAISLRIFMKNNRLEITQLCALFSGMFRGFIS